MNFEDFFIERATVTLKSLGDPTRLKILVLLNNRSMKSGEIAKLLSMSSSAISHQLKILKINNLVFARRVGKNVVYGIKDNHVKHIIKMLKEHIKEEYNGTSS